MTSNEGVNPLRPYYIPPAAGLSSPSDSTPREVASASSSHVFGSSARDLFPDLDYTDYLESSPSLSDWIRDTLDRAVWRYTSTLTAQPFDVAKTILQTYVVPDAEEGQRTLDGQQGSTARRDSLYDDSSDDESSYFSSTAPSDSTSTTPRPGKPRHHITDRSGYIRPSASSRKYAMSIKDPSSLMEVVSQLWSTSGPTSPWKATNATFIYSLLLPTLNTFIRSLLAAVVGLPEEDNASSMTADILTASSPFAALFLSCISSSLSAIVLSPIDTVRTYLILTPASHGPRSLLRAMRLLPTTNYTTPPHLVPITILHSSLPNFILTTIPLFLKNYLSIDPVLNPSLWNLFSLVGSGVELAVRFPLETVLRRAQIATFTSPSLRQQKRGAVRAPGSSPAGEDQEIETIVPTPRTYRGVIGTMWHIVYEEGVSPTPSETERARAAVGVAAAERKSRQGQGIYGLYRGWRIGMWGIVGMWGSALLGSAAGGGEDEVVARGGQGRASGSRF